MGAGLEPVERARYAEQGFVFPLPLLDGQQVARYRADLEAAMAAHPGDGGLVPFIKSQCHLLFPFADRLIREPALLDCAEAVLGPDLMVWGVSVFLKPPGSPDHITWHQDLTYWGLGSSEEEVTLWLALTQASETSGCMRFLPGSQRWDIVPHRDSFAAENMLSRGQEIALAVDEARAVPVCLAPGEASLHHGRLAHASGPNCADHPRIGIAIRYITPAVRQEVGAKDYAVLVRGHDRHNHFLTPPRPRGSPGPAELAAWQRVIDDTADYLYRAR